MSYFVVGNGFSNTTAPSLGTEPPSNCRHNSSTVVKFASKFLPKLYSKLVPK
jgi:hypothetical protein